MGLSSSVKARDWENGNQSIALKTCTIRVSYILQVLQLLKIFISCKINHKTLCRSVAVHELQLPSLQFFFLHNSRKQVSNIILRNKNYIFLPYCEPGLICVNGAQMHVFSIWRFKSLKLFSYDLCMLSLNVYLKYCSFTPTEVCSA